MTGKIFGQHVLKPVYVKQDQANGLDLIHVALGMVRKINVLLEIIVLDETYRVNLKDGSEGHRAVVSLSSFKD